MMHISYSKCFSLSSTTRSPYYDIGYNGAQCIFYPHNSSDGESSENSFLLRGLLLLLHDFPKQPKHDAESSLHLGEIRAAGYIEELTKGKLCLCDVSSK